MVRISKMKDRKLAFMSHLVWYILCFGIIFFIGEIGYALPVQRNGQEFLVRTVITLFVSLGLSIAAELLVRKGLMLFIGKKQKPYEQIMQKLQQNGMSEQLKNAIEEQYRECRKKPEYYVGYCNDYVMLLAAYHSDLREYDKALAYIDQYDLDEVNKNITFAFYQSKLVEYYYMKLYVESEAGERERADKTVIEAEKVFTLYAEKSGRQSVAELALTAYDILSGRIEKAMEYLGNKDIPEYIRLYLLAKCYAKQKQPDQVNTLLEELMKIADTDWKRNEVQIMRKELLGEE